MGWTLPWGEGKVSKKTPYILNPDDFELSQGFLLFEVLFNRFLVVERILYWRKGAFEDPSALYLSFKSRQSMGGFPKPQQGPDLTPLNNLGVCKRKNKKGREHSCYSLCKGTNIPDLTPFFLHLG